MFEFLSYPFVYVLNKKYAQYIEDVIFFIIGAEIIYFFHDSYNTIQFKQLTAIFGYSDLIFFSASFHGYKLKRKDNHFYWNLFVNCKFLLNATSPWYLKHLIIKYLSSGLPWPTDKIKPDTRYLNKKPEYYFECI